MSAEEKLQRIRDQNKARAKLYYETHKATIAERRKAQRAQCKQAIATVAVMNKPEPAPPAQPAPPSQPVARVLRVKRPVVAPAPPPPQKAIAAPLKIKRPVVAPLPPLHYDQALEIIATSPIIDSEGSRKTYAEHLTTLQWILKCDDFRSCFMDAQRTIDIIDHSPQKRNSNKTYSLNTKKAFLQAILKLSTVLSIPLTKAAKDLYRDSFEARKLDSKKQTDDRIEKGKEENQLTFEEYLPRVKEEYGEESKEYLIASLYTVSGFRDDLQLRITKSVDEESKENQLVLPKGSLGTYQIYLARYKTGKKYGPKRIDVPAPVSKQIKSYIQKNQLKEGDYLLGKSKLTGFISNMNQKMGLKKTTINTFREMMVNPVINQMSSIERVQLAKKMNHAPGTSERYRHKKK